jgi:hypothetical protein
MERVKFAEDAVVNLHMIEWEKISGGRAGVKLGKDKL